MCDHTETVPVETIGPDAGHPNHTAPIITTTGHRCTSCQHQLPADHHPTGIPLDLGGPQ